MSSVAGFALDQFQSDAVAALERGESVLVAAPTGAGKTQIAYEAIDRALARGERAVYTTPVKALSNQKHLELIRRLGPGSTGLLTGDRSIDPLAPVVVMTTEVLRALLLDETPVLAGVSTAILDEFHYIQNVERGAVWEEVVLAAPRDLTLVCLSATLPEVAVLHRWLVEAHGPTALVEETQRPVTLDHLYAIGNLSGAPPLVLPMFVDGHPNDVAMLRDGPRQTTRGQGLRVRDRDRAVTPECASVADHLAANDLLPAIWFVLSRRACELAAAELVDAGRGLNDHEESRRAGRIADEAMASLPGGDLRALNAAAWGRGLAAGIATHHSGLVPVQREAVERAFAEGLVKIVFATETLAVGVNLPARTVVIDRVTRPDGQGRSVIAGDEFAQLAGRAGRRGLDAAGHVIVPWSPDVPFYQVADLALGRPALLVSRLRCSPAFVACLAERFDRGAALRYLERSLAGHLARRDVTTLRQERGRRAAERADLFAEEPDSKTAVVPESRREQPTPVDGRRAALARLQPGDVIVDPGQRRPRPLLVLEVGQRRGEPAVGVVGEDARVRTLQPTDLRLPPAIVARLDLSGWVARERGQARRLARELSELSLPRLAALPLMALADDARSAGDGARRTTRLAALDRQIARLDEQLAATEGRLSADVDAVAELLERRRHLLPDFTLTTTGRLVRRLFHPQGLLIAEALAAGVFDTLTIPEIAAVTGGFRATSRGHASTSGPPPPARVCDRLGHASDIAAELNRAEADLDLEVSAAPDITGATRALHRWASGASLSGALEGTDLLPGDFVREVRQVLELIDQLAGADAAALPPDRAAATIQALDRDAVAIGVPYDCD